MFIAVLLQNLKQKDILISLWRRPSGIIDDIVSYSQPVVVLSGGEPLIRKDVFEIAKYGTDKGLRMCLATNVTLVNDEICEKIKASGLRIVSLSLDGSNSAVHDDFRNQKGAFDGTINAAKLFKKHGIGFIINSSFTNDDVHYRELSFFKMG